MIPPGQSANSEVVGLVLAVATSAPSKLTPNRNGVWRAKEMNIERCEDYRHSCNLLQMDTVVAASATLNTRPQM